MTSRTARTAVAPTREQRAAVTAADVDAVSAVGISARSFVTTARPVFRACRLREEEGPMPGDRRNPDATTTDTRARAGKRLHPAAIALVAVGAPFVAERPVQAPAGGGGEARSPLPQDSTPLGGTAGASAPVTIRRADAALEQRQLPFTGAELPLIALIGMAALATGALLRRGSTRTVR
jgi:hypothetical protein